MGVECPVFERLKQLGLIKGDACIIVGCEVGHIPPDDFNSQIHCQMAILTDVLTERIIEDSADDLVRKYEESGSE